MNTNNAPEQIELPNGCYWQETNSRNSVGSIYDSQGNVLLMMVDRLGAYLLAAGLGVVNE